VLARSTGVLRERAGSGVHYYGLIASVAGMAVLIQLVAPHFYNSDNLFDVLRQAAILGIVTLGQALVLLVAGIDLSVGAVMSASLILLAELSGRHDLPVFVAVLGVLAMGATVGLANGALVTVRGLPPFVATLGMAVVLQGAQLAYTRGVPGGSIPGGLRPLGLSGFGVIPYAFLLCAALAALAWVLLNRTVYGRQVYATGTNAIAARLAGVPTRRVVLSTFIACSLLAATAGTVLSAYVGYVDEYVGTGFDLDSIAAAVVGGVAFTGGKGGVGGAILGVLFVTVLLNLVVLLGVDPNLRLVVRGAVIVGAVAFFALRRPDTS
jgi:ribose/xylose/arabinose/galactoside ABC-type transport system permease subunit